MASAPHGTRTAAFTPQKGVHDLLYRLIIQQNVPFRNTKEGTAQISGAPDKALVYPLFSFGARVAHSGPQLHSSMLTWSAQQQRPSR